MFFCFFFIYILFLQYEAIHPTDEGIFVHRSGTVKRRFREFVNLQARLEDNPLFKKSMKGLSRMAHFLEILTCISDNFVHSPYTCTKYYSPSLDIQYQDCSDHNKDF